MSGAPETSGLATMRYMCLVAVLTTFFVLTVTVIHHSAEQIRGACAVPTTEAR